MSMATGTAEIGNYSYVQTSSDKHFDVAAKELQELMFDVMCEGYVPQGGIAYQCVLVNGSMLHILVQAIVRRDYGT